MDPAIVPLYFILRTIVVIRPACRVSACEPMSYVGRVAVVFRLCVTFQIRATSGSALSPPAPAPLRSVQRHPPFRVTTTRSVSRPSHSSIRGRPPGPGYVLVPSLHLFQYSIIIRIFMHLWDSPRAPRYQRPGEPGRWIQVQLTGGGLQTTWSTQRTDHQPGHGDAVNLPDTSHRQVRFLSFQIGSNWRRLWERA